MPRNLKPKRSRKRAGDGSNATETCAAGALRLVTEKHAAGEMHVVADTRPAGDEPSVTESPSAGAVDNVTGNRIAGDISCVTDRNIAGDMRVATEPTNAGEDTRVTDACAAGDTRDAADCCAAGDGKCATESSSAGDGKYATDTSSAGSVAPEDGPASVSDDDADISVARSRIIQELQRQRVVILKSRIMLENRLLSNAATFLGYRTSLDKEERKAQFLAAAAALELVAEGKPSPLDNVKDWVLIQQLAIGGNDKLVRELESRMVGQAAMLPVAGWMSEPEQRGMGLLSLAKVVGECGNLANYANPAKVWRRMGCAPYKGKMGMTWRIGEEGKLTALEWTEYGYSPRRRSVMYVISDGIVKQNKACYRLRYDQAKESSVKNHEGWSKQRHDYHARLLASKLFLKKLWCQWNKKECR